MTTATKTKQDLFPISKWGKDHWSLLSYCETRAVDFNGKLDLKHLTVNASKHKPSKKHNEENPCLIETVRKEKLGFLENKWETSWATRLKNGNRPDPNHDDVDTLFELQEHGFLEVSFADNTLSIAITEKGIRTAHLARRHKIGGGQYNQFSV